MAISKIGLNVSALSNVSVPSINISNSSETILAQITEKANEMTNNYLGLGILATLFFFLVYKLGKGDLFAQEQYSTIRSVGISAGVCGMLGIQFLMLGFFKEYYHVVIFIGILLLSIILTWLEGNK